MTNYIGPAPVPQAVQRRETFTATAGQTSFATAGYTVGYIDVYLNGVHLVDGTDYTATNGSDVVLTTGAADGDTLETVAFTPFQAVDQAFTGNTSAENLTATTADINGGTIDGTVIGGTTPAAGSFTSGDFSTGVYLGGTGSANLLDDYEEGTWSIQVREGSGGTDAVVSNVFNFSRYTRIGSMVHVYWRVNVSSSSSSTLHIAGLPFPSNQSNFQTGGGMTHGTQGHSFFALSPSEFRGYRIATGAGADAVDANGVYRGSFQYEVT